MQPSSDAPLVPGNTRPGSRLPRLVNGRVANAASRALDAVTLGVRDCLSSWPELGVGLGSSWLELGVRLGVGDMGEALFEHE